MIRTSFEGEPPPDIFAGQIESYAGFVDNAFSWVYLERPALVSNIGYRADKKSVLTGQKILDAGTGSGRIINLLLEMGADSENIKGIDISRAFLEIANRRFPEIDFVHTDISDSRVNQNLRNSLDLITCCMVLDHLDKGALNRTLKNFREWLMPGGKLIYLVSHPVRPIRRHLDTYFDRREIDDPTPWGTTVPYVHRTVSDYIRETISPVRPSFRLIRLDEPELPKEARESDPRAFENYSQSPSRLVIVAEKDF